MGLVQQVDACTCACGVMGVMGNKGAVAVQIVLQGGERLCLVGAHLCAGEWDPTNADNRCLDFHRIRRELHFDGHDGTGGMDQSPGEGRKKDKNNLAAAFGKVITTWAIGGAISDPTE